MRQESLDIVTPRRSSGDALCCHFADAPLTANDGSRSLPEAFDGFSYQRW
jgi:hypothetical protein